MTITSNTIVNQAIQMIGDNQPAVTGEAPTFDDSAAGVALQSLYTPCVQTVARQWGWDFARNTVTLTLSPNAAPYPWTYEYVYPTNGVDVWTLMPSSEDDSNNPSPTNWNPANAVVNGTQQRVIHTNVQSAKAVFNNAPGPEAWDALFREAVVRLLASELAMAIGGAPETSKMMQDSAMGFVNIGKTREG